MKLTDVKNQIKMFEYLKLKAMHHKVIGFAFQARGTYKSKARNVTLYYRFSLLHIFSLVLQP